MTVWLSLWLSTLQGQQTPAPVVPTETPQTGALQTPAGSDQSQAPAGDEQPKPVIDPKTGLPLTPAEQREKDVNKYDPLNRTTDLTGQSAYPLTDRELPAAATNQNGKTEPLPGSVAASNAGPSTSRRSGADRTGDPTQDPASQDSAVSGSGTNGEEYTGPAVLSRSYTLARPMAPRQIKWQAGVGYIHSWDIGQTQAPNPDGTAPSSVTVGNSFSWSLSGRHAWKHDQVGVSYQGNSSFYSASTLTGANNGLNFDYAHVVSRRLTLQFVESLSLLSQNYTLENPALAPGSSVANINLATSPSLQVLDNSVRQSSSTASMTFQKSTRLSTNLSTSYFLIARGSSGLGGMTGRQLSGDVNYRMTRKMTVGGYYSYSNYRYSHDVSESNAHGMGLIYSYAINRSTQLRMRGGASRIESLGYATAFLPPALAILLGQPATVVDAYSSRWISELSGELVRDFRGSRTASLSYARGMSPGNGLLLTSIQQSISAGLSARILKRFPVISSGITYSKLTAISQAALGSYKSETVFLSTSRTLRYGVSSTMNASYIRYSVAGTPLLQRDLRISIGLTWSPPMNALHF